MGWSASVSSITGLARSTIGRGLKDLDAPPLAPGQVRREGGGPRSLTETDVTLLDDLKRLVEPATLGDPARPLLWVSKSLDKLASALVAMGHSISPNSVRKLLIEIGFSRQVNRKADEGSGHPDRNAQFEYINAEVLAAQAAGQPVAFVAARVPKVAPRPANACCNPPAMASKGVRCERLRFPVGGSPHPAKRSSRKQPEQSWSRRSG